jgi:hypothetical protein
MPSLRDPEPISGVADEPCLLTPVPVPAGALLPLQDGTLVCRETPGATRWRIHAFPPGPAPAASARLRRIGSSGVVLDDAGQWSCAGLDTGDIAWGPVPFGVSRLARLGDNQLYWNYVPVEAGQVLAGLDPGSGVVRVAAGVSARGSCCWRRQGPRWCWKRPSWSGGTPGPPR